MLATLKKAVFQSAFSLLLSAPCWLSPALAQDVPEITPSLKKMLGALPLADLRDDVQGMVGALKKTSCGAGLKGCYATKTGPLQLYFFTSQSAQQTFLLVINKKIEMPHLLKDNVQKMLGGTSLQDPIISISTSDYELDVQKMPADLQKIVRDSYFNVNMLQFSSGVQLAAHADLNGAIKLAMQSLGVKADQLTMRAGVVLPIPTDLVSGAGAGAGLADAMRHGDSMKKAAGDALDPEAYVEFQFAPNAVIHMTAPQMDLTDATFFINNALTFGYKGNASFAGVKGGKTLLQFQTPLTPAGVMDFADFQFRMALPPKLTLEDGANMMIAMASPDPRLVKYGGGFIRNIESIKKPLQTALKPLSVFEIKNPVPPSEYKFGDRNKPFPDDPKYFNVILLGPTADGGPLMKYTGGSTILGQTFGMMDVFADVRGFSGSVSNNINIKLGPLGRVVVKMLAEAVVDKSTQRIRLKGSYIGQSIEVALDGNTLSVQVNATCVNPFEIKTKVTFNASTNIADVFEGQGGANVDPSKIQGCIGKDLEAAYRKVANEYKSLSGYSAKEANEALKKMSGSAEYVAAQAEKQAEKQAEAARKEYEKAKDAARDAASKSTSAASRAFNDAGNAFKRFGKKKKHKSGPDPKFASSVFDWDYYYDHHQDVVKAHIDLATHWRDHGFNEGRQGSPEFKASFYWKRYLDVQQDCRKDDLQCVLQHWLNNGIDDGRQGSADFSVSSYLNRYPDLLRVYGTDRYDDVLEHWLTHGEEEGRDGRPDEVLTRPISGARRVGGGGGSPWSDSVVCKGQYVIGWRLRAGKVVDMVQFKYPSGWAEAHGDLKSKATWTEVNLKPNEYVTKVEYGSGSAMDRVKFFTNTGRSFGPFGGGGGSAGTYTVTPGEKLGCMRGRQGARLDQVIFSSTGPR